MGLKCSVLGHAYGETTVERDREERGSEVVITIRELETCDRCGDTRIVSENKEVTTIETSAEEPDVTPEDAMAALEDSEESAADPVVEDAEGGTAGGPSPDAVEDQGAEILDEDETEEPVDDELADPTVEEEESATPAEADEEDAVFIDEGEETAETDAADEPAAADEADASGPDASEDDERGPFEPPADDDHDLGEWPEETLRDDEDDWTPSEELSGTVGDVDDSGVDRTLSTNSAVTVPEGEFYCEECGYTTPVEASSLRAGDYCPECHEGALAHRAEE